jgi:hypothetical protein
MSATGSELHARDEEKIKSSKSDLSWFSFYFRHSAQTIFADMAVDSRPACLKSTCPLPVMPLKNTVELGRAPVGAAVASSAGTAVD